jgi:biotin carboxylase
MTQYIRDERTTKKPVAIVLGGTNPHIALIEKLKKRGYYTILVDYFSNPPAKAYADEHIRESTLDQETVLNLAADRAAKLVISICVDQANLTACYVAEKLNLPHPYSYETALSVTDKTRMKVILSRNAIPTAPYIEAAGDEEPPDSPFGYPVMVKPADACGSSGVKKACNETEFHTYLRQAKAISRTGRALIEKFLSGNEVSAYFFIQDGIVRYLYSLRRYSVIDGNERVVKCHTTIGPADMETGTIEKFSDIARLIAKSFRLDNTPFFIQCFEEHGELAVVEFAPRLGGGLSFRTIEMYTGCDVLEAAVDAFMNRDFSLSIQPSGDYYLVQHINAESGVMGSILHHEELINEGVIEEIHQYKLRGVEIGNDKASSARVAGIICKDTSIDELLRKAEIANERLMVVDIQGNPIMRKDLCMTAKDTVTF